MGLGDLLRNQGPGTMLAQAGLPTYWSEAGNMRNRLVSKASVTGKTAYFNSLLLSLGWSLELEPKDGKKCKSAPIIILGNRESKLRVKARGIGCQAYHKTMGWS